MIDKLAADIADLQNRIAKLENIVQPVAGFDESPLTPPPPAMSDAVEVPLEAGEVGDAESESDAPEHPVGAGDGNTFAA